MKVMRRVHFIYYIRQVFQPLVLSSMALSMFVGLVGAFVSVEHVFRNMLEASSLADVVMFVWNAFAHTSLAVEASLLAGALSFVAVAREFYRSTRSSVISGVPISVRL